MLLTHRLAQPDDVRLYFDWTNDPDTRRQSFSSASIPFDTHAAWFSRKLADPDALMLVFENKTGQPVGQVRFERSPNEIVIGISVDAAHRGKGLASQLIELGCVACRERWGSVVVHAYIKPENRASARAFERAGFAFSHESDKFGVTSLVYVSLA